MPLHDLLRDVTGGGEGESQRSLHIRLANQLNSQFGEGSISVKGVAKWFERGSIPGKWLLRIATVSKKKINLTSYT